MSACEEEKGTGLLTSRLTVQPIFLPSTSPIFMQSLKTNSNSRNPGFLPRGEYRLFFLGVGGRGSTVSHQRRPAVQIKARQVGETARGCAVSGEVLCVAGGVRCVNQAPPNVGEEWLASLAVHNENEGFILQIKQKQHTFKWNELL